jgi:GPH family glycoside/pentoside/hexuronide:cation symporter
MTEAIVPKPVDLTLSSGRVQSARLPWSTLLTFSAPMLGIGFMGMLTGMYLMKFSTDVLGISPAAMGVIFFVSRIWDAISDPLVGFLSDRTRSRLGRRRPWMIAGALPVGILFVLMWTPPELSAGALPVWMGVMVVLFYTATTVFGMPHDSLGAELSTDYHDRTRIFAVRRIAFGFGAAIVLLAVARLAASPTPRAEAFSLAAVAAIVTSLLMLYTGSAMRERPEYQGRGAANPLAAVRDILANPHARILLGVFLIQQLAVGGITVMAAYHAQYVMGRPEALSMVLGAFFLVSIVSIPLWMVLARHFDKKPLLVASMIMSAVAMGSIFFVEDGSLVVMLTLAGLGGFSSGGADVVFPSLEADVIDYDEYRTGERKEGMYFAAWHFAAKTAIGGAAMLTGFVLAASGFEPNVAQAESARFAIRALMSLFPLVCFGIGVLLFLRFRLTREAHAEIRAALDERRTSGQPVGPRPLQ